METERHSTNDLVSLLKNNRIGAQPGGLSRDAGASVVQTVIEQHDNITQPDP
jgi:ERCC4-type nuclease